MARRRRRTQEEVEEEHEASEKHLGKARSERINSLERIHHRMHPLTLAPPTQSNTCAGGGQCNNWLRQRSCTRFCELDNCAGQVSDPTLPTRNPIRCMHPFVIARTPTTTDTHTRTRTTTPSRFTPSPACCLSHFVATYTCLLLLF